jgi:hypothetical protein
VVVQRVAVVVGGAPELEWAARFGPTPLVPEPGEEYVRIRTGVLSGRRFTVAAHLPSNDTGGRHAERPSRREEQR